MFSRNLLPHVSLLWSVLIFLWLNLKWGKTFFFYFLVKMSLWSFLGDSSFFWCWFPFIRRPSEPSFLRSTQQKVARNTLRKVLPKLLCLKKTPLTYKQRASQKYSIFKKNFSLFSRKTMTNMVYAYDCETRPIRHRWFVQEDTPTRQKSIKNTLTGLMNISLPP